jgi:hypothetical protein
MDHDRGGANLDELIKTLRVLNAGVWTCCVIAMAASMLNGWLTFHQVQAGWELAGLATALSIDACLCLVVVGDRQLQTLGLSSGQTGRVMRGMTAAMSLIINCGLVARQGQYFLMILHSFVTLVLVGVTEYREVVAPKLHEAIRQTSPAPPAEPAERVPLVAEPTLRIVSAPAAERSLTTTWRSPQHELSTSGRAGAVKDRALAQLREWRDAGRDLTPGQGITYAELAEAIDAKPDTCYRGLASWCDQVLGERVSA